MSDPVALVLRDLPCTVNWVGVNGEIAELVDTWGRFVASLHQVFQVREPSNAKLLSSSHVSQLWHELLQLLESRRTSVRGEYKTACA